ncbi:MAG TPA: hypothetical protein VFD53_11860 [Ilumatobacter sp.]|jgi:hypothetical protein|nr:hypothetical protein [Ilumatobacter sp.]
MHPELSSSVAQIRFSELGSRFSRRSRISVASDAALPPPRERDPVGRDRRLV